MFVLACLQYSHTHSAAAAAAATHNHTATCSGITDEAEIYNMEMLHFQQMRLKKKKKKKAAVLAAFCSISGRINRCTCASFCPDVDLNCCEREQ